MHRAASRWLVVLILVVLCGCSPRPREQQLRSAGEFSKDMDQVRNIDIIAPADPAYPRPVTLIAGRDDVVVAASLTSGKDEPDFHELRLGLKAMLERPLAGGPDLITRMWLRLRIPGRDYAYYCMYEPRTSFLALVGKGPLDLRAPGADKQWHEEMVWAESSPHFREVLNRHIPAKWLSAR